MKAKFEAYSLELQEVLIGTPRAPAGDHTIENILIQLRSRQVAREQVETYQEQEKAAVQERTLNEAKATAAAQAALTQSLIQVKVHENEGSAALARAQKDAETAQGDGGRGRRAVAARGPGRGGPVLAVGTANAQADQALRSMPMAGRNSAWPSRTFASFADALTKINQPLVPQFLMSGAQGQESNNAGLIPTAMLSSMFGQMMPDALERLKDEAPNAGAGSTVPD